MCGGSGPWQEAKPVKTCGEAFLQVISSSVVDTMKKTASSVKAVDLGYGCLLMFIYCIFGSTAGLFGRAQHTSRYRCTGESLQIGVEGSFQFHTHLLVLNLLALRWPGHPLKPAFRSILCSYVWSPCIVFFMPPDVRTCLVMQNDVRPKYPNSINYFPAMFPTLTYVPPGRKGWIDCLVRMAAVPLDQISPEQKEPIIVTLYHVVA